MLQNELMEIVQLKTDTFQRRFKAEYGAHKEPGPETEASLANRIEQIRDSLFNVSLETSGKELISKFKMNLQRLKEFMNAIDKEIGSMAVFNQREDDRFGENAFGQDDTGKFSSITSV